MSEIRWKSLEEIAATRHARPDIEALNIGLGRVLSHAADSALRVMELDPAVEDIRRGVEVEAEWLQRIVAPHIIGGCPEHSSSDVSLPIQDMYDLVGVDRLAKHTLKRIELEEYSKLLAELKWQINSANKLIATALMGARVSVNSEDLYLSRTVQAMGVDIQPGSAQLFVLCRPRLADDGRQIFYPLDRDEPDYNLPAVNVIDLPRRHDPEAIGRVMGFEV